MELDGIKNKTLRQRIYVLLKEKMMTAEILPGEQVSLRSLAEQLGVSISPVREALLQLETEDVVVINSNKSIHVNYLTLEEMEELLRVRIPLETMAAKRACDLRPDSALPQIKALIKAMWDTMDQPMVYLKNNRDFHSAIYRLAESPILFNIISGLWVRIQPYIYLHVRDREETSIAMAHHENIYEALVERDKEKISQALEDDLQTGAVTIKSFMSGLDWDLSNYKLNLMLKGARNGGDDD